MNLRLAGLLKPICLTTPNLWRDALRLCPAAKKMSDSHIHSLGFLSELYPTGLSWRYVGLLVLAGFLVVSLVVTYSPDLGRYLRLVLDSIF